MGFKCGIVGLPNVGKSTLFNALTSAGAAVAGYPFTTVEPNVGVVAVPEPRLAVLKQLASPHKTTPATIEVVDIAGLIKGASKGEGLGNQFLSNIRAVDALLHVVRCFEQADVPHVSAEADPTDDIATIETELMLSDLEIVEKRIGKDRKVAQSGDRSAAARMALAEKAQAALAAGTPLRNAGLPPGELAELHKFDLITPKPVLYVANTEETSLSHEHPMVAAVRRAAEANGAGFVTLCGKLEAEIAELAEEERQEYLAAMGMEEPGLAVLAQAGYRLLGLVSFFTVVGAEIRAWAIPRGTGARSAAGKIHSDMERGFIKAEVIGFEELERLGSLTAAREQGRLRIEGKDYVVQEGDVITFRFNV
jgi:GTP-binding protein YchF